MPESLDKKDSVPESLFTKKEIEKLFTSKQVAEALQVSRMTLLRLREKRRIGFFTLADGRSIRFSAQHIEAYLKGRERPAREPKQRSSAYVN